MTEANRFFATSRVIQIPYLRNYNVQQVLIFLLFFFLPGGEGQRSDFEKNVLSTLEALQDSMSQLKGNPSITQTEVHEHGSVQGAVFRVLTVLIRSNVTNTVGGLVECSDTHTHTLTVEPHLIQISLRLENLS